MSSRIAKLLSFVRGLSNDAKISDVEIDTGGGDNKTAQHFSAPGDDSFPLKTDYVLAADVARNGGKAAHGYLDPINDPVAQEGDKRIYGRDPSDGSPVNQAWLKSDGSVLVSNDNGSVLLRADGGSIVTTPASTFDCKADGEINGDNGSGYFKLVPGGTFEVNNVTIDPTGNITTPVAVNSATVIASTSVASPSMLANGKQLSGHTHPAGTPPGDTGVNN